MNQLSQDPQYKAFVQEIISNPQDETARLIFADFLEEVSDPRAELIRIQFQLNDLPPFDPQRRKLRTREKRIAKKHGLFTAVPKEAKVLDTLGGFVDSIEITVTRFLKHYQEIFAQSPIRKVVLKGKSANFAELKSLDVLGQLSQLTLRSNEASLNDMIDLISCKKLQNIEGLIISHRDSTSQLMEAIGEQAKFNQLKHLSLTVDGASTDLLVGASALANSDNVKNLVSMYLYGQTRRSISALSNSRNFGNLRTLSVSGDLSRGGVQLIQTGPAFKSVEQLTVHNWGDTAVDDFQVNSSLPNLTYLDLGYRYPSGVMAGVVSNYPNLTVLDLAQNRINDRALSVLAESPLLGNLERLTLTSNQVTIDGVRTITNSKHWSSDTLLYLASNRLTGLQMQDLRKEFGSKFGNFGDIRWKLQYEI